MSADRKCTNCGFQMENAGIIRFRVGGSTGMFATVTTPEETIQPLQAYKCSQCQKVDFYAIPKDETR